MGLAFWMSIAIGMLFMILLFHIFKASWPIIIRRQLEHGMVAFPCWQYFSYHLYSSPTLMRICLAMVIMLTMKNPSSYPDVEHSKDGAHGDSAEAGKHGDANAHDDHGHGSIAKKSGLLWKWMALDGTDHHDILLTKKEAYLNKGAFTVRFFLYFAVFCGLGFFFRYASISQDKDGSAKWTHLSIKVACGGIVAMALATTFAAIDWYKAIEHHWFSTMYGVWYFAASMRAALATTVILCFILATRGNLKGFFNQAHRYDLGVLMFAFTIFWAYILFTIFLIYNADIRGDFLV